MKGERSRMSAGQKIVRTLTQEEREAREREPGRDGDGAQITRESGSHLPLIRREAVPVIRRVRSEVEWKRAVLLAAASTGPSVLQGSVA